MDYFYVDLDQEVYSERNIQQLKKLNVRPADWMRPNLTLERSAVK